MPGKRILFEYNHRVYFKGTTYDGRRCFKTQVGYLLVPAGVAIHNNDRTDAVTWRYKPHVSDIVRKNPNTTAKSPFDVYDAYERLLHRMVYYGIELRRTNNHNQFVCPPNHSINDVVYGVKLPKGVYVDTGKYEDAGVAVQYYHPKEGNKHVGRCDNPTSMRRLVEKAKNLREQAYERFERENTLTLKEALAIHSRQPRLRSHADG